MKRLIHTPEGFRDIFGRECDKKRYLENQIEKLFRSYGYQSIMTPYMEFDEVFSKEVGTTPTKDLYRFFDREGNTLVLRPDFTPSIARSVSMYFQEEDMPLRLCYTGSIFSNNTRYSGRLKESTQMGIELLNDDCPEADAEVVALAASVMLRSGLFEFQITVGNVGYFDALVSEAQLDEDVVEELRHMLDIKNRFGVEEIIEKLNLRNDLKKAFLSLPDLTGGIDVLQGAKKLTENAEALDSIVRLEKMYEVLKMHGADRYVSFDLGMVSAYKYYTGILMQVFTYGTGDAVIKGGRYNRLLEQFGKSAPAIGFTTEVDSLLNAIERQGIRMPVEDIKTMVLYPAELEALAIRFAGDHRMKKMDVACIRFDAAKVLDDYKAYGKRNQFGGIIYFRSAEEVYAINLANDQVQKLDVSAYQK